VTGAEKYLRSLVDQNEYITNMIRRKEELIERSKTIKTVDTSVERVQTSHNTDRICDITTEIAALEQEIEEEDAKLWKSMYEFKQLMNNVHDIAYIRVLNQIYFLFHTPERAAQELKRSRSWIYTKHEEAVKAFEQGNEEFLNRWVIERMNNSEQIERLMNQLYEIQQKKQQVEDEESEIRATLLETMKKEQIEKLENVKIKINYIDKSYRRTVNGKLLRELYPDAFWECTNRSEVQPHLRVQMMSA